MSAISSAVASSKRSTMAGIVSLPAILDERQRRSPAMISYWFPDGRTRIGWSTPCSLMDAASSCSVSSCQVIRGCDGFGTTFSSGSSRTAVGVRAARRLMLPGCDALQCVVLRLHRDDHAVRRDERIQCEKPERRRAVDEDVGVPLDDVLAQLVAQRHLTSDRVEELHFSG